MIDEIFATHPAHCQPVVYNSASSYAVLEMLCANLQLDRPVSRFPQHGPNRQIGWSMKYTWTRRYQNRTNYGSAVVDSLPCTSIERKSVLWNIQRKEIGFICTRLLNLKCPIRLSLSLSRHPCNPESATCSSGSFKSADMSETLSHSPTDATSVIKYWSGFFSAIVFHQNLHISSTIRARVSFKLVKTNDCELSCQPPSNSPTCNLIESSPP